MSSHRVGVRPAGLSLLFVLLPIRAAVGDVGVPVKISVPPRAAVPAVSGVEYAGTIEVACFEAGTLGAVRLEGEGWQILETIGPKALRVRAGEVVAFRYRAVPRDADQPLRVRISLNGRTARRSLLLGKSAFDRASRARRVGQLDAAGRIATVRPVLDGGALAVAGQAIRFHGRIAYMRPSVDGGPQNMLVGADGIYFDIIDDDSPDPFDETIYSGVTDEFGNFDVVVEWDDCDITGCDDPDIYLYFETDNGVVNVQDTDLFETDYSWDTQDRVIEDFQGSDVDFGTVLPADMAEHAAIHIHNSIMRAHRFVLTRTGTNIRELDVLWPEDEQGSGAFYTQGSEEIHIAPSRQWREDTHIHEYGHHFIFTESTGTEPDYCNYTCDCEPTKCDDEEDCGHCLWCPETDHDAWNEGWPNWFADVVTRSIPADYGGYNTLYTRSQEFVTNTCTTSAGAMMPNPTPLNTEGFVGALLRDIEDASDEDQDNLDFDGDMNPDDSDGDGVPDCWADAMTLGVADIFTIVREDQPTTLAGFLAAFRDRYPEYDQDLWSTVRNVHPSFGFPAVPPKVVSQSEGCRSFLAGENLVLSVQGDGRLLTYQWRRDGVDLADGGRVSGATSPTLAVSSLATSDGGSYDCVVSTCDQSLAVQSVPVSVQVFTGRGSGTAGASWGRNDLGQLGRGVIDPPGAQYPSLYPAPMAALGDAVKIAGGGWFGLALMSDGSVHSWGYNLYYALGRTDVSYSVAAAPISGITDAVAVAAGTDFGMALHSTGRVLIWGADYYGQLGTGVVTSARAIPQEVPGLDCVVSIAAGVYHAAVVKSDGSVWAWGYNGDGALGRGTIGGWSPVPQPVSGIEGARAVAAVGYHTLVLLDDGTVLAFGRNFEGQLGDGTEGTLVATPQPVPGLFDVAAVRGGWFHSLAILEDGTVRAWGNNTGALGDGTLHRRTAPVQPLDVGPVLDVAGGYYHTLFLRVDRTVWVTGWNAYGELGPRPYPEPLRPLPLRGIAAARAIGAGAGTSYVVVPGVGPYISLPPVGASAAVGQSVSFAVAAFGTPTLSYAWQTAAGDLTDGFGISGAKSDLLMLDPVTVAMAGMYSVRVENTFGLETSVDVALNVFCAASDANCDGRIDVDDVVDLAACLAGPGGPRPGACDAPAFNGFDANDDGDVDLRDVARFQNCFAGAGRIVEACAIPG